MDELELKAAEPTGIPPEEITLDFPAQLAPAVGSAILDDEAILLDPATGTSHLLDGPATLIVQCLDGVSPLSEIAADIAEGLGLDRETIENDVLTLVRELGEHGLVDGVLRVDRHAAHAHENEMPMGVPQGSDLGGWEGWVASRPKTGQTLVVNWGTHCGYCTRIAEELGELSPRLEAAGVGLLLVTLGTPDELHEQLGEAELRALHVEETPEFFAGLGTPAAYLVDQDLRTVEPLALGAGNVPDLARRLSGAE
jgi:PqqD family protein of HPr-rel-A system